MNYRIRHEHEIDYHMTTNLTKNNTTPLTANQYSYFNNITTFNTDGTNQGKTGINILVEDLQNGDFVTVEADIKYISGDPPFIRIAYCSSNYSEIGVVGPDNVEMFPSITKDDFVKVKLTFIYREKTISGIDPNGLATVLIGSYTRKTSNFSVKNIVVKSDVNENRKFSYRKYTGFIVADANTTPIIITSDTSYKVNIGDSNVRDLSLIIDPSDKRQLSICFPNMGNAPVVFCETSIMLTGDNPNKYLVKYIGSTSTKSKFICVEIATNVALPWDALPKQVKFNFLITT